MTLLSAIFWRSTAALSSSIQAGSSHWSLGTRPYEHGPEAMADVWRLNSSLKGWSLRKTYG